MYLAAPTSRGSPDFPFSPPAISLLFLVLELVAPPCGNAEQAVTGKGGLPGAARLPLMATSLVSEGARALSQAQRIVFADPSQVGLCPDPLPWSHSTWMPAWDPLSTSCGCMTGAEVPQWVSLTQNLFFWQFRAIICLSLPR